mmetsp:Transcript_6754/g.19428  ORF Transcript_6754/g.19428 Transcript_6754/m.19428 type:complete len:218 (-) Transcript_6754:297-950(-)
MEWTWQNVPTRFRFMISVVASTAGRSSFSPSKSFSSSEAISEESPAGSFPLLLPPLLLLPDFMNAPTYACPPAFLSCMSSATSFSPVMLMGMSPPGKIGRRVKATASTSRNRDSGEDATRCDSPEVPLAPSPFALPLERLRMCAQRRDPKLSFPLESPAPLAPSVAYRRSRRWQDARVRGAPNTAEAHKGSFTPGPRCAPCRPRPAAYCATLRACMP